MNGNPNPSPSVSLLDSVRNAMTPDLMSQLSSYLGSTTEQAKRGLWAAVPAVLAGLVRRGSTEGGAQSVITMMKELVPSGESEVTAAGRRFEGLKRGDAAMTNTFQKMASTLFGDRAASVVKDLAQVTNLPETTMAKILNFATPFVLAIAAKRAAANNFSASWLAIFLTSQRNSIVALLPAGLGTLFDGAAESPSTAASAPTPITGMKKRPAWLFPAAAVLIILAGVWLARRTNSPAPISNLDVAPNPTVSVPASPPEASPNNESAPLTTEAGPPATESRSPSNGSQLADTQELAELTTALETREEVPTRRVVALRSITFTPSTSDITPAGAATIQALATMLKEHPYAVIRIEAHAVGEADTAANKQLSLDRALLIKNRLVNQGVNEAHLAVAGVGDEKPIASGDAEEDRIRNTRVEVVVLSTVGDTGLAH